MRVVDDADADCAPGEDGQVVVRGHNMMSGYLDDAEATAEAMRDGWMHTGDVGRIDAEGRLAIVDRVKDMIIRGGNNVYPSEVEAALCQHPAIAEAAVVGRPDDYYGEEIVAAEWFRAKDMPNFFPGRVSISQWLIHDFLKRNGIDPPS